MESSESPPERACPSCGAPAQATQRWCLECGGELPGPRRPGMRPAIGIATTLAVLVGAASAGGYTLLQETKQPPPPAPPVAQAPAPAETLPPATEEPLPVAPAPVTPPTSLDTPTTSSPSPSTGGVTTPTTRTTSPSGSVEPSAPTTTRTTPPEPRLALTDIALGAVAVPYAPYADDTVDLGDASRMVDGSKKTVWKAPAPATPGAGPQAGAYVDLAGRETIRKLVLRTPTNGIDVEIYGANGTVPEQITDPGWDHLADRENVRGKATLKLPDRPYRYVLVWIVGGPADGSRAAISELSLLSLQPE